MKVDKLPEGYDYNPLPDCVYTGKSPISGEGLFAAKDLRAGEVLGTSHYDLHCSEVIYNLEKSKQLEKEFPMLLIRTRMGSMINHAINASVIMVTDDCCHYEFKLIKDVLKGEELTIDYNKTPCFSKGDGTKCDK